MYRFKCEKLKCSNKYPNNSLSISPGKVMGPRGEREKISDPSGVRTHDLWKQIIVALPTELQGQMGADCGKLRCHGNLQHTQDG